MILLFATVAAASTVPDQLDAILKDYGRADTPGASVLVALDGKVLYRKAFGLANLEERTPITTATNFRLASVTKQLTATAVLLLAERGELSLDDPLTRFFPGFASFASTAHGVKVRHLLGHTSGLLDYEDLIPPGTTVPVKDKDVLDLVGKQDRLYFAPGSQFRYSNTGYALLALIVEKVSGRSFAQFLEKNIFDPLGMAGTVAYEEGISKVVRRAYGYSERDGRFERTDQSLTSSVLGDGGIYSSVEDLWLWDQALYGTHLLPAETLAMAFQAGTPTSDQPGSGYGYGWYVASHRGTRKIWHYGETLGFSTYLARYPDKRLTIIMLTNRNDNFLGPTVDRIADVILGAPRPGSQTVISLRGTLRSAIIAAALLATACGRDASPGRFPDAPVILISVDTLRADHLPAYGYRQVETPNIDGLRRDSVLFERVYSHCPMTLPSHASMFTGSLPTENGVRNNIGYRFEGAKLRALAEELRERGYATGAAVSSYVLRSDTGIDDGFDFYEDSIAVATAGAASEHQRSGRETLKHALPWILGHREQPFFFFLHLDEPHAPYAPPEPFKSRYPTAYDGEIAAADAIIGELIRSLKASGLYDRAIIIFTSDHGEGLWDHGEDQHGILLYREALWVPLLVKLPGSHQADSISRDSISQPRPLAHLFGTVLRLVGIDLPSHPASWFDARTGGETGGETEARPIYSETLYPRIHLGWSELRSLIDGRYHYIEAPSPELYDLERDPGEARNLITIERREASRLRQEMEAYPATAAKIGEIDPEEARKLAALGYVGTPRERGSGPLPNPRDEVKNLARIKAAFRLADERRLDEAAVALRSLLQENPRLMDVGSKLGEVLVESGRYDEAIEVYRSAIAHAERFSPDLALALGFAYLKRGNTGDTGNIADTAAAATHARLALTAHPREANELLARVALEEGRFDAAEEHVRSALQSGDSQPATLLLLADVERTAGKLERALRTVQEAERRAADLGVGKLQGADYLRGDVLARLDRPEEAAAAYRREIAAFPQHLQAYANLAVILMIQGRGAEANELLEQMARSNPHRGAFLLAAKTLEVFEDRQGAARWRQRAAR